MGPRLAAGLFQMGQISNIRQQTRIGDGLHQIHLVKLVMFSL